MATRMLAFLLLLSQPGYTLLTRVATAWQLGCGGAAVHTPQGAKQRALLTSLKHRLSQGDSSLLCGPGVVIFLRLKADPATPLHQHFVSKHTICSDFALVRFSCA